MIVANFTNRRVNVDVDGECSVEIASDSSLSRRWNGVIEGEVAVVLRPYDAKDGV